MPESPEKAGDNENGNELTMKDRAVDDFLIEKVTILHRLESTIQKCMAF